MSLSWIVIAVALAAAFLIFKFLVKPLFKIIAILALVAIAWWLLHGF